MTKQNIIYYTAGCYGTFFEWYFNWSIDPSTPMPFSNNGSSHKFSGNMFEPKETVFEYVKQNQKNYFSRIHPGIFPHDDLRQLWFDRPYYEILQSDLNFLQQHFDQILILCPDHDTTLWCENNSLDKASIPRSMAEEQYSKYGYSSEVVNPYLTTDPVTRLRHCIDLEVNSEFSPLKLSNLQGWNKNNIYDFDIWQLRELLSFYWFTQTDSQTQAWQHIRITNPKIMCVTLGELRNDFFNCMHRCSAYFNLGVTPDLEKLKQVYSSWHDLQQHINKDRDCKQIVDCLVKKESADWSHLSLSILDEAWIQKQLRNFGIGVKCDGLNTWPTNSKDFLPVLEEISQFDT